MMLWLMSMLLDWWLQLLRGLFTGVLLLATVGAFRQENVAEIC